MGVSKRPFLSRTCTVTCLTHVKRNEPCQKKILNQYLPNRKVLFVKLQIHTTSCLVLRLHFLWSIHCLEQKLSSSLLFALFCRVRVGGGGGGGGGGGLRWELICFWQNIFSNVILWSIFPSFFRLNKLYDFAINQLQAFFRFKSI